MDTKHLIKLAESLKGKTESTMTPAYYEGRNAFRSAGGTRPFPDGNKAKNPYNKFSSDYYDWIKGWNQQGLEDILDEQYEEQFQEH